MSIKTYSLKEIINIARNDSPYYKELYKIVKKSPKGSAETKRSYEEIITIAQSTNNLSKLPVGLP